MKTKKYTISLDQRTHRELTLLKLFLTDNKNSNATLNDAVIMAIQETFIILEKKGCFKKHVE